MSELDWQTEVMLEQVGLEMRGAVWPNPPCVPWCTTTHQPWEFVANEGLLYCAHKVGAGPTWSVTVERVTRCVDEHDLAGPTQLLDVEVQFTIGQNGSLESLHASEIHAFRDAVAAAAAMCEQVTR